MKITLFYRFNNKEELASFDIKKYPFLKKEIPEKSIKYFCNNNLIKASIDKLMEIGVYRESKIITEKQLKGWLYGC